MRLAKAQGLHSLAASVVQRTIDAVPPIGEMSSLYVEPPTRDELKTPLYETPEFRPRTVQPNYLELEALNRSVGLAGEQFVATLEHRRLWLAGKRTLADRIEHVSVTRGDGLGYDVLSFEESGKERLIEVKTTRFGQMTPFFVSRNEVGASEAYGDAYHLYRLFAFQKSPRLYTLDGSLRSSCELEPVSFSAFPI